MTQAETPAALPSGLLVLDQDLIERLPEQPAHYRLRASGQRVMYVGHAAEEGLQQAIRTMLRSPLVAGLSSLEYQLADDSSAAEVAAREDINGLKPLYNDGFGRFRNTDVSLPTKGHRIRKAIQNP